MNSMIASVAKLVTNNLNPPPPAEDDDAEIARRLQQQFEEQFKQEQIDLEMARRLNRSHFDCAICMTQMSTDDVFIIDQCQHRMCRDCAQGMIQVAIDNNDFPLRCPTCKASATPTNRVITEISQMEALTVLTPDYVDKMLRAQLTLAAMRHKYSTCPQPDCKGIAELVDGLQFRCPLCNVSTCTSCKVTFL